MRRTRRKTGPEPGSAMLPRKHVLSDVLVPQPRLMDCCKLALVHQLPKFCRCGPSVAFLIRPSIWDSTSAAEAHHVVAAGAAWAQARLHLPLCYVKWLVRSLPLLCCGHNFHIPLCCSLSVIINAPGPQGTRNVKRPRPRQGVQMKAALLGCIPHWASHRVVAAWPRLPRNLSQPLCRAAFVGSASRRWS